MLPTGPVLAVSPAASPAAVAAVREGDCPGTGSALVLLAPEAAMVYMDAALMPAAAAAGAAWPPLDSRALGSGKDMLALLLAAGHGLAGERANANETLASASHSLAHGQHCLRLGALVILQALCCCCCCLAVALMQPAVCLITASCPAERSEDQCACWGPGKQPRE